VFLYVLKERFSEPGAKKVESGQFALEDSKRKRDIDLRKPWDRWFRPGQHVQMDMIFQELEKGNGNACPGCGDLSEEENDVEVTWYAFKKGVIWLILTIRRSANCDLTFRRIEDLDDKSMAARSRRNLRMTQSAFHNFQSTYDSSMEDYSDSDSDEDDIRDYMRVRLIREREIRQSGGLSGPNTATSQQSQRWSSQSTATNVNIRNHYVIIAEKIAEGDIAYPVAATWQKTARSLTNLDNDIF
jgi:hypothetical protein